MSEIGQKIIEGLKSAVEIAQGKADPQSLADAPVGLPVRRLDETTAARRMVLTEDMEQGR